MKKFATLVSVPEGTAMTVKYARTMGISVQCLMPVQMGP